MPTRDFRVGRKVPDVDLAQLVDGAVLPRLASEVLGKPRVLVVGVPGAYTPICSIHHVPQLVANADRLRKSGFDDIVCVVASDPFSTAAWVEKLDPTGKVRFFSDGNLDFARSFGLLTTERALFMGECSERYLMTLRSGVLESLRIERKITDLLCTQPDALFLDGA